MKTFEEFLKNVSEDNALSEKFWTILTDEGVSDKESAIIALAADAGFTVTAADIKADAETLLDHLSAESELTDEELDAVAGGEEMVYIQLNPDPSHVSTLEYLTQTGQLQEIQDLFNVSPNMALIKLQELICANINSSLQERLDNL